MGASGARGLDDPLARIVGAVRAATGVDFSHYTPATLRRRIERRMRAAGLTTMDGYAALLDRDHGEAAGLCKEMLFAVTRFFRDEAAFRVLAGRAVEGLMAGREGPGAIRVWVCGCATGEEAYSIAILFAEARERLGRDDGVTILATDIDRRALELASLGAYSDAIAEEVSPERLARFFVRQGERYTVAPDIRRTVDFAPHDVTRDPPLTGIALVSCRNLLIHRDPPERRGILERFRQALRPDGFLFLGTGETPDGLEPDFHLLEPRATLLRRSPPPPPSS
ncbi:CheR family methyltransferase [Azospirillum doebereinerae]|uniref:CheR family methyltransferase n=1 Tax=Azospirillum doebereinerae TaxID=92933 RepID=UPI001EE61DED|nr:CheR family methyltransferase [Azospirillum doebereinerae]MCG5242568.1 hypothetical protein [Azospirillum doebereinerae]